MAANDVKAYLVYTNRSWLTSGGDWTSLIEDAAEYYEVEQAVNAAQLSGIKTKFYVLSLERE